MTKNLKVGGWWLNWTGPESSGRAKLSVRLVLFLATALLATPAALADPCEGKLPEKAGIKFEGKVRYIVDGDGFCVGATDDPNTWIEVRLANFNAPELKTSKGRTGKQMLSSILMGRQASCISGGGRNDRVVSYDRVIASCRVGGEDVGKLLKAAGASQGGN